ncbi:MAG: hypothetical protein FD123_213 [Bacteroidetes bacterium]|nr:MAG: hypothetical protein FD123_213 [Bacteroidota bacterium]
MKQGISALFGLFFLLISTAGIQARTCTAIVSGGDWSNPATWSCGTAPGDNDTIIIPVGFIVTVDINSPTYVNMVVYVDGTLDFENGMKLNMCQGTVIVSATGQLSGGTPGSKINICGSTVWNGPGPTTGPIVYGSVVLPVELLSFTATLQPEGHVAIAWITASEKNNQYFTVERSTNGLSFSEIARVDGAGNSTVSRNYSATDPDPQTGVNYYRLRQTDFNGQSETFQVVAVNVQAGTASGCELQVYPNPCVPQCTVKLDDCPENSGSDITIDLIDASGKQVFSTVPVRDMRGSFTLTLDSSNNLKPGVYMIRGTSNREKYMKKVVIR